MTRQILRIGLAVAFGFSGALTASACGNDDQRGTAQPTPSQPNQAGQADTTMRSAPRTPQDQPGPGNAVREYLDAYAAGDGQAVCELVSEGLREATESDEGCISDRASFSPPKGRQRVVDSAREGDRARVLTVTQKRLQTVYRLGVRDGNWLVRAVERGNVLEDGQTPSLE